jgi:transforming growth factor-beta-induced protein
MNMTRYFANYAALLAVAFGMILCLSSPVDAKSSKVKSINSTVNSTDNLSSLQKDLVKSGAARKLGKKGKKTLFAPSNQAYSKVPKEKWAEILEDPDRYLEVISYHVVPKEIQPEDIDKVSSLKTAQGESVMTNKNGEQIVIDGAMVVGPPIVCKDGVIYVIDEVLFPERGK